MAILFDFPRDQIGQPTIQTRGKVSILFVFWLTKHYAYAGPGQAIDIERFGTKDLPDTTSGTNDQLRFLISS